MPEQILETPQPTPIIQPSSGEPKKKSNFKIIVILLIVILLICAGFVYAKKFLNKSKACTADAKICPDGSSVGRTGPNCEFAPCPSQSITPSVSTETIAPKPSEIFDETTNWKTYKNEKYGFEFKYPENKVADFQKEPYNGFCNDNKRVGLMNLRLFPLGTEVPVLREMEANDIGFFVYGEKNFENVSLDKWIEKNCPQVLSGFKVENATIAGSPALRYTRLGEGMGAGEIQPYLFFSINNNVFYIHPYGDRNIFNIILSTVKFTKQNLINSGATGVVTGKLCYPSDFLPPGNIVAKNIINNEIIKQEYAGSNAGGKNTYSLKLSPGNYKLRYEAHASLKKPEIFTSGYYTYCSVHQDQCASEQNHETISVEVKTGETAANIDLCDFYYGQNNEPQF